MNFISKHKRNDVTVTPNRGCIRRGIEVGVKISGLQPFQARI